MHQRLSILLTLMLKGLVYLALIYSEKWDKIDHTECYKDKTYKTKIERVKSRFAKLKKTADIPTVVNVKLGRPPKEQETKENQDPASSVRP